MKINEIIRSKRLEQGLTQEQVASYLGVSAPAVNKWERAVSYPDITLLPPLARLLGTDLNTLLSFREELSPKEISDFLGLVSSTAVSQGFDQALAMVQQKIQEYPTCDLLLLNAALTIDGLAVFSPQRPDPEQCTAFTDELYLRAARSNDPSIQNQARAMLFSVYMRRKEYDKAKDMLEALPDQPYYDKAQMASTLYLAENKLEKAAQTLERKLLTDISGIMTALLSLMEISLKEDRRGDAEILIQTFREAVSVFDLWDYEAYLADFQLAMADQDSERCLNTLKQMFPAMERPWDPRQSPLYRHLPAKEREAEGTGSSSRFSMAEMFRARLLEELRDPDNEECAFLRADPRVREFLEEYTPSFCP